MVPDGSLVPPGGERFSFVRDMESDQWILSLKQIYDHPMLRKNNVNFRADCLVIYLLRIYKH
jgi:hypothetical protein